MAKLSKAQWADHDKAEALIQSSAPLTLEQIEWVYANWTPMAKHNVGKGGIFFTPPELARQTIHYAGTEGVVFDLCAGIGALSFHVWWEATTGGYHPLKTRIVAIEINEEFVAIGRRLLPMVEWVCGDVFDRKLWERLGVADFVISNPPFGNVPTKKAGSAWLTYNGPADLMVAEVALRVSRTGGTFILPQQSTPFRMSGDNRGQLPEAEWQTTLKRFVQAFPGVQFGATCLDTSFHDGEWRGANPRVEVVEIGTDCAAALHLTLPLGLGEEKAKRKKVAPVMPTLPPTPPACPVRRKQQPQQMKMSLFGISEVGNA